MGHEQQSTAKKNEQSGMNAVSLKKSGDEGIDIGLVDHYLSMGFQYRKRSGSGSAELEIPKEIAESINKKAIEEHYGRVRGAQRASVGPDVNLVEDRTETFTPKTAEEFLGGMGLEEEPE